MRVEEGLRVRGERRQGEGMQREGSGEGTSRGKGNTWRVACFERKARRSKENCPKTGGGWVVGEGRRKEEMVGGAAYSKTFFGGGVQ